ncbi:PDDEXK-like family protein [Pontibacter burrus]|uniref:PD-(D/E)XK nuclease family protein n=1 Tax=Pontibacter burrus TaxID=2704466 RepID=A0A6B3LT55_9BACT|nr:PD-(D/E)XK nuclease family protein [Pontibacter burrus]NEM97188.1 PD-(D/E)XK nuclease family protein [Pontibacter burrus]
MQTLLDKIGVIDFKYKKLREQDDFNIFGILRSKTDEVRVHSRFIAELLNPKGSHRLNGTFLESFLEMSSLPVLLYPNPQVHKEYKDIDILIRSGTKAIIIENKIWARDQKRQLDRYYEIMKAEGAQEIKIIYLTLDGKEPSEFSLGTLKNDPKLYTYLYLCSYGNDILPWLDSCLKEVSTKPTLRETLVQYKKLIEELTGNSMPAEERNEIKDLLSVNDNILKASKIVKNWKHIKWYTEWDFWNELEAGISNDGFNILPNEKFDVQKLNSVIHKNRNRNPWFGIMIELGHHKEDIICLYIRRGTGNIYCGITVLGNGKDRLKSSSSEYDQLAFMCKSTIERKDERWIAKKYFSKPVNFETFSDKRTLLLADPSIRKKYIADLWNEAKAYLAECKIEDFLRTRVAN